MSFYSIRSSRWNSALLAIVFVAVSSCAILTCTGCSDQTEPAVTEQPTSEVSGNEQTDTEQPTAEEIDTEEPVTEELETQEPETGLVSKENFNWRNADVVFVGDSITSGRNTTKTYHSYLKDMGVFRSVKAQGYGGSCFSTQSDYGLEKHPLTERYTTIPSADLIVIFMGTNDYGHETPLGTITDTTDVSFYGALNVVVSGLREQYPDSQLVFATPLHRFAFGESAILGTKFSYDNLPNGEGHSLEDYVNAIKAIAEKYDLPVIDLFTLYPYTPENVKDKVKYFPDGLHPNAKGHEILAELLYDQLALIPNESN